MPSGSRQDKAEPRNSGQEAYLGGYCFSQSAEKHGGEEWSSSKPGIFILVCNLKVLSYIYNLLIHLHKGLL